MKAQGYTAPYHKKIAEWIRGDKVRAAMVFLAVVIAVTGLLRVQDYGVSYDEPLEYRTSVYTWEYAKTTLGQLISGETVTDVTGFLSFQDNVYGSAARFPVFLLMSQIQSSRTIWLGWHIYNYLWFLAAAFCTFLLLRKLLFSEKAALLGMLMYLMMPRIFAESAYNIKDILFLSLFTVTSYFGYSLSERMTRQGSAIFALLLALCTNTRYIGCIVMAPVMAVLFMKYGKRKGLEYTAVLLAVTALFYYVFTPYLWTAPVSNLINMIRSFTNNPERYVSMYFAGRQIGADELPWYYLHVWIGITMPLWILLSFVCGSTKGVISLVCGTKLSKKTIWLTVTGGMLGLMLLADAVMHTVKYDGWRHFYFLYAWMVPIAVYGFAKAADGLKGKLKTAAAVLLAVTVLSDLMWSVFRHPYEMVYMNPVGMCVNDRFETDYWLVSMTGAIRSILEETEGSVSIWLGWDTGLYLLEEKELERIQVAESIYDADYVIMFDRVYRWNGIEPGSLEGFEIWKEQKVGRGMLYQILRKI